MSFQQFAISNVNPNDSHGGGGCACDPRKQIDCTGPYVVFYGNEMEDVLSPHVVIGCKCLDAAYKLLHKGEALEAGERATIPESSASKPLERAQRESPVVESPDPKRDFEDLPKI